MVTELSGNTSAGTGLSGVALELSTSSKVVKKEVDYIVKTEVDRTFSRLKLLLG